MTSTAERARHRWREILPPLGIDTRFLRNDHGPCPLCVGRDRFRFDDKDGSGSYFCNGCGAGDGFILAMKFLTADFVTVANEIDRIIGLNAPVRSSVVPASDPGKAERLIQRALAHAQAPDVVARYLQRRGLSVTSAALRGDASAPTQSERTPRTQNYPTQSSYETPR
jgi:putative DNA primase/helicase